MLLQVGVGRTFAKSARLWEEVIEIKINGLILGSHILSKIGRNGLKSKGKRWDGISWCGIH